MWFSSYIDIRARLNQFWVDIGIYTCIGKLSQSGERILSSDTNNKCYFLNENCIKEAQIIIIKYKKRVFSSVNFCLRYSLSDNSICYHIYLKIR